jgi:transposase-like protein
MCIDPIKTAQMLSLKETQISTLMEDDIKRWTAKRKAVLVMEIIQGKTTVAEASRSFDLPPLRSRNGWTMPRRAWRTPACQALGHQGTVRAPTS